jgi:hypothetical protein
MMNPQQPFTPAPQPKKRKLALPIILMVWPAIGIILTLLLFAISNFIAAATAPPVSESGDLFAERTPQQTLANVLLFLLGGLSIGLGPISFIVGLVLLIINLQKK